jgi:hypothetical protein
VNGNRIPGGVRPQQAGAAPQRRKGEEFVRDYFGYTFDVTFTATSQRLPFVVNIQADADWVLVKITGISADTPADNSGGMLLQIEDTGSGRKMFDAQMPFANTVGSAQRPFILPWVHRFPRNGTILFDVTNTGTNANRVRLGLHGYKIIPASRL